VVYPPLKGANYYKTIGSFMDNRIKIIAMKGMTVKTVKMGHYGLPNQYSLLAVSFSTNTSPGGILQSSVPMRWTVEMGNSRGVGASESMISAEKELLKFLLLALEIFLFLPLVVLVSKPFPFIFSFF
jgi:hypothetical protein